MNEAEQSRFALMLAFVLIAGTFFTYSLVKEQYHHPMPERDCSSAYEYPMCERAAFPEEKPEPKPVHIYLGSVGAATLMIILVFFSFNSTITGQKGEAPKPKPEKKTVQHTPDAIPHNTISPEAVAQPVTKPPAPQPVKPPKAKPSQGVNVKGLEDEP